VSFELTILGSSSALPTSKRFTTAHLLNINERFFLVDCGEGVQIQLRKFHLSPARINHIFISHLHGDHVFGLFGLLSSLGMMGRHAKLNIYGPEKMKEMVNSHLSYFGPLPYTLNFHVPVAGEIVYEDSKTEVLAVDLLHRTQTFGYVFREKARPLNLNKDKLEKYNIGIEARVKIKNGADFVTEEGKTIKNEELTMKPWLPRSYAYISDTAFKPSITDKLQGVDILFHEATFLEKDKKLAKKTLHSTARQAAEIAKLSNAGKLLIGHFSTRYKSEQEFVDEASELFKETVAVNDGDVFSIPLKKEQAS
jgi:ribonuclease Z